VTPVAPKIQDSDNEGKVIVASVVRQLQIVPFDLEEITTAKIA
jgi:hypothetical protein